MLGSLHFVMKDPESALEEVQRPLDLVHLSAIDDVLDFIFREKFSECIALFTGVREDQGAARAAFDEQLLEQRPPLAVDDRKIFGGQLFRHFFTAFGAQDFNAVKNL